MAQFIANISGERVAFPDDFDSISIRAFLEVAELIEKKLPKSLIQKLYGKDEEDEETLEITAQDVMTFNEFKVDYLSIISGCKKDTLRRATATEKDGVIIDLNFIFERCSKFLQFPTQADVDSDAEFITVNNKKYFRAPVVKSMFGKEEPLGATDFGTWSAGQSILTILDEFHKGDFRKEYVITLAAVMYRPKIKKLSFKGSEEYEIQPYSEEEQVKRSIIFEEASAAQIFAAYFFLSKEVSELVTSSQSSLTELLKKVNRRSSARLVVATIEGRFERFVIGLSSLIKSLKRMFSTKSN